MTILKVILGKPTSINSTQEILFLESLAETDTVELNFQLYNNSSTDKFKEAVRTSIELFKTNSKPIESNVYSRHTTYSSLKDLQRQMNENNRILNSKIDVAIPENLFLEISDNNQVDKLNSLHFYFESTTNRLVENKQAEMYRDCFPYLETINQLVHIMEGYNKNIQFNHYHVTRLPISWNIELTDEDYRRFLVQQSWGVLTLDFSTVGKDLWACANTNDVGLVKNKQINQQRFINPHFDIVFNQSGADSISASAREKNRIREFLVSNGLDDDEFNKPKYFPGRLPLGEWIRTCSDEEIKQQLSLYSKTVSVELVD